MNKKRVLLIIIIALLIVSVSLSSLGFFFASVNGNATNTTVTTGKLKLNYTETNLINLPSIDPGVTATKTFTIQNTGDVPIKYSIYLLNVTNTFVNNELVYTITSTNGGSNKSQTVVPTSDNILLSGSVNAGVTQAYTLQITFKETGSNQNSNQGALFSGELDITADENYSVEELSQEFEFVDDVQTFTAPIDGVYQIELWGASGYLSNVYGGYTSGNIQLNKNENLFVYVGEGLANVPNGDAFNAGVGSGGANAGGGATDVRLTNGEWDNDISLNSRIMVAAGSGSRGANAGGLKGYDGGTATGATQVSGGIGADFTNGQFGKGGNGWGGGSGYYGGGGASGNSGSVSGGGSSYISGHTGCVSIQNDSVSNPRAVRTTGCTTESSSKYCSLHYSNKYFTNTKMIDGSGYSWSNTKGALELMPKYSGGTYLSGTGNRGNGYAKITYLTNKNENLLSNANFGQTYTSTASGYAWDRNKNPWPVIVANGWASGYNSGVQDPTLGYHAYFDNTTFDYTVMNFTNNNSDIGHTNRWLGISQDLNFPIVPNTTYTISMDIYSNTLGTRNTGGLYHSKTDAANRSFYSGSYNFNSTADELNRWVRKSWTFTTVTTYDITKPTSFYIYGHNGVEGITYVKNVKLELGNKATDF